MAATSVTDILRPRHTFLVVVFVLTLAGCNEAASLADTRDGDVDASLIGVLSIVSCICLAIAAVGCSFCCRTGFAKFEETTTEQTVIGQNYTSFADFSPPTISTPSHPPGATETDEVTIEPLPHLPGRTNNQWVNVLRVGGEGGSIPGQTVQSIKLIDSPRFQFPRSQISYVDEIGNGWFGKVLQGEAQRMHPGLRKTRVVVKQLRDTASPEEQLLFLQEVQPYREVNHPNVLLLLGQCIDSMPLLLILEYAPFGDLKSYLRKHRSEAQEMALQDIQLKMAADMISGLMWLHQADFIYVDLATRNCQVSADTSIKIGDYGLALEKYPDDYYITKDNSQAIPIRWLGPEVIDLLDDGSVKTKKITKESNVWSFGIMMLELSTGAKRPYAKLTDEQVLQQVVKEQEIRVDKPNLNVHYASRWFEIMMYCWLEADIRPTMKELHDLIMYLKRNRDRIEMPDFEARWNSLKPAALQESSESSKEEEGPSTPLQKNPAEIGFGDNFVHPLAGTPEKQAAQQGLGTPVKRVESPVVASLPSKIDSPAKTAGFDSDFGKMPLAPTVGNAALDVSSPNRNMNAETSAPDDQQLFDDFVTAAVQPTAESAPHLGNPPTEGFESDFVTKSDVSATPPFTGFESGIEMKDTSPKKTPQSNLYSPAALSNHATPEVSPTKTSGLHPSVAAQEEPPASQEKDDEETLASMMHSDVQRTSTPLSDQMFESSTNISEVSRPEDDTRNSFLSSASMIFNKTPAPSEVSLSFHSVATPASDDRSFISLNDATPSTIYQTPDQSEFSDDDTFDTMMSSPGEEPTFIVKSDVSPAHIQLSNPFNPTLDTDHSPTEFTGFVTAEMAPSSEKEVVITTAPSSDVTQQSFQIESGGEPDGSLVVEPPGDETLGQSVVFNFTDSAVDTPAHEQYTSHASFIPSPTTQITNSPFTFTMSAQEADQEGALNVQSGDVSVSHSMMSSSSSSSRVVKTMRTVRRVQIVDGEEVVTEVTSPSEDSMVSVITGSDDDGVNTVTLTGGELQSSSQQMSSFQSSHQTSSSSVMRQTSSGEKMSSISISQGGELTSNDGTMSFKKQMSGEMSSSSSFQTSSSSVMRQTSSSDKMLSFSVLPGGEVMTTNGTTAITTQKSGEMSSSSLTRQESDSSSEMVGDMESAMQQMNEDNSSSVMRQMSSSSSKMTSVKSSQMSLQQISSSSSISGNASTLSQITSGAEPGDNTALLMQTGSLSSFSQSSSSKSITKSEVSSRMVSSTAEQDGEVTVSHSMSAAKSQQQQQSSSIQLMTQSSGDAQQPLNFDLNALTLAAPNGHSLVQSDPAATVENTMTFSTGPGQMTVGQEMTMQGGGSATGEMTNGGQVSVQWQGSASKKQEHSVFTSKVTSDGEVADDLPEGLPGQSSQLAVTSPDGNSSLGN